MYMGWSAYVALEYMEGGEIQWRDENEMPVMGMEETRSIFRSVVSGLDYRKFTRNVDLNASFRS